MTAYLPRPREFGITQHVSKDLSLSLQLAADQSQACAIALRDYLQDCETLLNTRFQAGQDVRELVAGRTYAVDQVLHTLWHQQEWPAAHPAALIAVGGYGRGELFPHSDIDLLLVVADENAFTACRPALESFITTLWDLKLDIGHSVRTLADCRQRAADDITIATNLLETRCLCGDAALHQAVESIAFDSECWDNADFFSEKVAEQEGRHQRYGDSEYNLEPNLKTCPGGLRDIQTIGWIAKRHLGLESSRLGADPFSVLTDDEHACLHQAEGYLWQLRFGLQMLAGRNENRLLFNHQRELAKQMGFIDGPQGLAVEQMMQRYYRYSLVLSEINDVLLQHFEEAMLLPTTADPGIEVNRRFRISRQYLEASNPQNFFVHPTALIEVFLLLAQHPGLKGIRAGTIRAIRAHRHLIDHHFRTDLRNTSLFIEILRTPHALHETLAMMRKYGVLANYLPAFDQIIGRMQHDLFHIYTVDAHTLRVIRNMVRLQDASAVKDYPLASWLVHRLPKLELLYLAGLFHDIAKGRGGDHSKLGVADARDFCTLHKIGERDTSLVCWLVENHLLMSITAQRKDISDPEVVHEFAARVQTQLHLDYLYVLTVCDISATNPSLWNGWRASLLRRLYSETLRCIRCGLPDAPDRSQWLASTRDEVRDILRQRNGLITGTPFATAAMERVWPHLPDEFFLQDSTFEIAWQLAALIRHEDPAEPLVRVRAARGGSADGYLQITVYARQQENLFHLLTSTMDSVDLNIVEARLHAVHHDERLCTFVVSTEDCSKQEQGALEKILETALRENKPPLSGMNRRIPRQLKHFSFKTQVHFSCEPKRAFTVMELVTPDRPGLLARIAHILREHRVSLASARIATLGERVEDVFTLVADGNQKALDAVTQQALATDICRQLDTWNETKASA